MKIRSFRNWFSFHSSKNESWVFDFYVAKTMPEGVEFSLLFGSWYFTFAIVFGEWE